jgi:hypothetical protein
MRLNEKRAAGSSPTALQPRRDSWAWFATKWFPPQAKAPPLLLAMDELPSEPFPEPPRDLGEAHASMTHVIRMHPDLGFMGFGTGGHELLLSRSCSACSRGRARGFLSGASAQGKGAAPPSYWLKHLAGHDIGYTYCGPFLAGAVAEGLRCAAMAGGRRTH